MMDAYVYEKDLKDTKYDQLTATADNGEFIANKSVLAIQASEFLISFSINSWLLKFNLNY